MIPDERFIYQFPLVPSFRLTLSARRGKEEVVEQGREKERRAEERKERKRAKQTHAGTVSIPFRCRRRRRRRLLPLLASRHLFSNHNRLRVHVLSVG